MTIPFVITRTVAELRPHPLNETLYGDRADADLVESIRTKGVLSPLLVTRTGLIISGHRRWGAARAVGLTSVPVTIFGSDNDLDIREALIETNKQRLKTNEQLGAEAIELKAIAAERAKVRQLAAQNNNAARAVRVNLPEQPNRPVKENFPELPRQARDDVGARLGVSGKTAEHAAHVVSVLRRPDVQPEQATTIRETLNNKSIHAAYEMARKIIPPAPPRAPPKQAAYITLADWSAMSEADRRAAIARAPRDTHAGLNRQDTDRIEWAQWSWNPVTGCLHECPYCYARDIADRFYAQKFVPSFLPDRLHAPRNVKVPDGAAQDIGLKNIFTCSMADLFGKWVPQEWIDAVFAEVTASPQWNFLFLTKFPQRLAEQDWPANAWVGTTVDRQARVATAERSFTGVKAGVKWLSCEPLLERLTFTSLDMFDWVVIGGSSRSTETPEFQPPWEWVEHLIRQARDAGCRVYLKPNCTSRPREYPGNTGD